MPILHVKATLSCELCGSQWTVPIDPAWEGDCVADGIEAAVLAGAVYGFIRDGALHCPECDSAFMDYLDEHHPGWHKQPTHKSTQIETRAWPGFKRQRKNEQ